MRRSMILLLYFLTTLVAPSLALTADGSGSIQEQFRELARLQELTKGMPPYSDADAHDRELIQQYRDARLALLKRPTEQLLAAIDQSIRGTDKLEIVGALDTYGSLIVYKRVTPDPRYKPLLLGMLAKDNFSSKDYNDAVAGALGWYPSRETLQEWMDVARRAPDQETHDHLVDATAAMLDIEFNYTLSDPTPDRKRQAIAAFETWYEKNKDTIRFDKDGEPHFHGGPGEWKPPKLTSEDKTRIKADPVCVLRLFESIQDPQDPKAGVVQELNSRCGRALLGKEGSSALAKALEQPKDGSPHTLEQQFSMSSGAVNYPTVSAALTAVAYVASADIVDPEAKLLAVQILDDFGEDLEEILKGEPSSVRKKIRELADSPTP